MGGYGIDPLSLMEDIFGSAESEAHIDPRAVLDTILTADLRRYQRDILGFYRDILQLQPWSYEPLPMPAEAGSVLGNAGQLEILKSVQESVDRQLDGEEGVPYIFLVEAPHGVGKTFGLGAPLMLWFYACFRPSVIFSTAPTLHQVKNLLWKDLRTHAEQTARRGHNIAPGLLPKDPRAEAASNHFMYGQTTSDSGGKGQERSQGQHNDFQMIVFDEGEGVPDFMYDGAKRQLTGNKVRLHLLFANPKTTTSMFQKTKLHPLCRVFRMSLLSFPNVVQGRTVVPGGTTRSTFNEWVVDTESFGCQVFDRHDESRYTFELPWAVPKSDGSEYPPGTIFAPMRGFLYGALGIPPASGAGDTLISLGRVEAALKREPEPSSGTHAQIGIDCGRFGDDPGKVYRLDRRELNLDATIQGAAELDAFTRTDRYVQEAKRSALLAHERGATSVSFRVDGSGGYGGGIVDGLLKQEELRQLFPAGYGVHEVQFGGTEGVDTDKYADRATEMYALADEVLTVVALRNVGQHLTADLTERKYSYITKGDRDVKKLERKELFKKRNSGRSPDDGDGAALALAPERLFQTVGVREAFEQLQEFEPVWVE